MGRTFGIFEFRIPVGADRPEGCIVLKVPATFGCLRYNKINVELNGSNHLFYGYYLKWGS